MVGSLVLCSYSATEALAVSQILEHLKETLKLCRRLDERLQTRSGDRRPTIEADYLLSA